MSKNENIKKSTIWLNLFEIIFFVMLAIFTLHKAIKGRNILINILFNNAILYFTLTMVLVLMAIITFLQLRKNKAFSVRVISMITAFLLAFVFLYNIFGDYSSFYMEIPSNIDAVTVYDVFDIEEGEQNLHCVEQAILRHPLPNVRICEVQQSFANNSDGFFYSLKVVSTNFFVSKLQKELISYLCKKHSLNYRYISPNIYVGNFEHNKQIYDFLLKKESKELCCIIYRGAEFSKYNLSFISD